jgi:hypothetical protein
MIDVSKYTRAAIPKVYPSLHRMELPAAYPWDLAGPGRKRGRKKLRRRSRNKAGVYNAVI